MYDNYDDPVNTFMKVDRSTALEAPEPLDYWMVEDFQDILPSADFNQ